MQSVIIKRDRVHVTATAGSGMPADSGHEKTVRAIERDGRVTALELVCRCGETTLVELVYDAAQASAPTPETPPGSAEFPVPEADA